MDCPVTKGLSNWSCELFFFRRILYFQGLCKGALRKSQSNLTGFSSLVAGTGLSSISFRMDLGGALLRKAQNTTRSSFLHSYSFMKVNRTILHFVADGPWGGLYKENQVAAQLLFLYRNPSFKPSA